MESVRRGRQHRHQRTLLLGISLPTIRARCRAGRRTCSSITPENSSPALSAARSPKRVPSLTLTTTGISATAVSGTTYTASIYYANLANTGSNNGPNVTLNILAGGVVVGTGSVTGLAPGSPWTQVTATWTATSHIGSAIQLQVVANNFLEGTQVVEDTYFRIDPRHSDGHGQRGATANGDQRRGIWRRLGLRLLDPRRHGRNCSLCRGQASTRSGDVQRKRHRRSVGLVADRR